MPDHSIERVSRLIEQVYLAGLDRSRWQGFVDQLAASYPGTGVSLLGHDAQSREDLGVVTSGHAPEFIDSFQRHYASINPWFPDLARMPVGTVLNSDFVLPRDDVRRTEFYHDWLRPQGDLIGGYGTIARSDGRRFLMFNLTMAEREMERYVNELTTLCALLGPHLRNAVDMTRAAAGADLMQTRQRSFEAVPCPLFAVDLEGVVCAANAAAEHIFPNAGVVAGGIGAMLAFRDPIADGLFRRSLRALVTRNYADISPPFTAYGRESETEYQVTVAPCVMDLEANDNPFPFLLSDRPVAMVFLAPKPTRTEETLNIALKSRGLTPAEMSLASAILQGHSVQAYADDRRLSIHTVRNQLRSIYRKLDVGRQGELVALLGRMSGTDPRTFE